MNSRFNWLAISERQVEAKFKRGKIRGKKYFFSKTLQVKVLGAEQYIVLLFHVMVKRNCFVYEKIEFFSAIIGRQLVAKLNLKKNDGKPNFFLSC